MSVALSLQFFGIKTLIFTRHVFKLIHICMYRDIRLYQQVPPFSLKVVDQREEGIVYLQRLFVLQHVYLLTAVKEITNSLFIIIIQNDISR